MVNIQTKRLGRIDWCLAAFCLNLYFVFHRYRGYCPQIKYRVGKTYGTDTHELARVSIFFISFLSCRY